MAEQPIGIFFSYAHADDELRDQLARQLKILEHQQIAVTWCDRQIPAGSQWADVIDDRLNAADIILLLISPDFLSSDFCMKVEYPRVMERQEAGEACIIPVLLRSCPWKESIYNTLQAYPKDLVPVTSWSNRDEALYNVTQGILAAVKSLLPANQSLLSLPVLSKPKELSQRISIRFNCANDFAGGSEGAGTIAYLLIRTKVETSGSVPFEVSSEAFDTAEQMLRSLDSLTARTPEEEKEYRHLLRVRDGTGDRLRTFEEALRLTLDNEALRNNTFLSLEERLRDFLLGLRDELFGFGTPILPETEHEFDWFSEVEQRRHMWWVWWKDDYSIYTHIKVDDQELTYAKKHYRSGKYNQFPGSECAFKNTAFDLFQLRLETFYRIALPTIAVLIVQQWSRNRSTVIPSAALDLRRWAFSPCVPDRRFNALD